LEKALEVGNVVTLNSGGPKMTVTSIPEKKGDWDGVAQTGVGVCWVHDGRKVNDFFPAACLRLSDDKN
jgi:uncharacterized protein YodC (DUF2158 family)